VERAWRLQNDLDDGRIADDQRRRQGLLWCAEHERHDECVQLVPYISQKRALEMIPAESRGFTWEDAYIELMKRYAPPDA
jgi:hypothetical protein